MNTDRTIDAARFGLSERAALIAAAPISQHPGGQVVGEQNPSVRRWDAYASFAMSPRATSACGPVGRAG
ncbi:hypothetical protein AV521_19405 [Streptomyces sp. IMTB 2501]|uniref:hypothetical protein n=1 Tax=Streptomyces sp. IMTB 2501 TaxID=1776340 RepID=UPI00097AA99B|nr:hypothetical protein [Streptomyces sp. IMTB 2501]OLZ68946.1 hypothetical protein AV521_19405 [Streptomyces sp. IMTB 2501]